MRVGSAARVGLVIVGAAWAVAFGGPANAFPTSDVLSAGNGITFGQYTVYVVNCTGCTDQEFSAISGNKGFIITGSGGGTLLDATTGTGPLDISVDFEITTTSPILSQVALQVAGGDTGDGLAKVNEQAYDPDFTFFNSATGYPGGGAVHVPFDSGPYSDVYVTKDISADPGLSGTATITSVSQTFDTPEPASIGILGMGFIALMYRKRRRS